MKSQSSEGVTYRVAYGLEKFTCECPYHVHWNGCRCKHIAAAEYMLLQNAESSPMKETIIDEMKLKCTGCGSQEYVKNGHDKVQVRQETAIQVQSAGTGSGTIWALRVVIRQRTRSGPTTHHARQWASRPLDQARIGGGPEHVPAAVFITLVLMLNGMELSPVRIQLTLKHLSVDVHADTISRWLVHYVTLVEKYTNPIQPLNLGSKLGADEKRQDVKGEENYFALLSNVGDGNLL